MSKWATRAIEHFAHTAPERAPVTPRTHLMGVLGVVPPSIPEKRTCTEAELIAAAMRACNHWKDSDLEREEMRLQVLAVPGAQRAELIEHFKRSYQA